MVRFWRTGQTPCTKPCRTSEVSVRKDGSFVNIPSLRFPQNCKNTHQITHKYGIFLSFYLKSSLKPELLWKTWWKTPSPHCPIPTSTRAKATSNRAKATSARANQPHLKPSIFSIFLHFYSHPFRLFSIFTSFLATNKIFLNIPRKPLIDILRYFTFRHIPMLPGRVVLYYSKRF